jgi:hypothetical protein
MKQVSFLSFNYFLMYTSGFKESSAIALQRPYAVDPEMVADCIMSSKTCRTTIEKRLEELQLELRQHGEPYRHGGAPRRFDPDNDMLPSDADYADFEHSSDSLKDDEGETI